MVAPINDTTSTDIGPEVRKKYSTKTLNAGAETATFDTVPSPVSESDGTNRPSETIIRDKEKSDLNTDQGAKGEVRKMEMKDGEITTKVYDSNGKLLRKIPPGYLPMGEQKFDVTV